MDNFVVENLGPIAKAEVDFDQISPDNTNRDCKRPFFWLSTESGCDIPQKSKKAKLLLDYNIEWRKTYIQKEF